MKKLIEAILHSKVGKAVLALILGRFLNLLKDRALAQHGSEGVYIHAFLNRFEDSLIPDFIETHEVESMHQELTDNGVKDDTGKKGGFLASVFGASPKEVETDGDL